MGFLEAFADELNKIAMTPGVVGVAGAAKQKSMLKKIHEWIKANPGKSGIAAGWMLRGLFSGGNE